MQLKWAKTLLVPFLTQYDTKTLLFAVRKEDIGQEITEIVAGAIESMHNLPVNLEGAGIPGETNGNEIAINEVPEFEGGVNGDEAAIHEITWKLKKILMELSMKYQNLKVA